MSLLDQISPQEKAEFVKNLALLIRSGKPINESLDLLSDQIDNRVFKKALKEANGKVEKGTPLHQALSQNPNFGKVFTSFIRAGEESGTLQENLEHLADWLERNHRLKREINSATLYPKIVVLFAIILGGILSVAVLPQLVLVFGTLQVELPFTTRILLRASELIRGNSTLILTTLLGVVFVAWLIFRLESVKRIWHKIVIKIPILGSIYKEYQLTIISQLITTLFQSGVTINESLDIISESVTNLVYRDAIEKVRERVSTGVGFADAMTDYPQLFPSIFISVVLTGEQTGSYGDSFQYLADFFAERITEKTEKLPTILEPVLLIVIGVFVAVIASAIIMPIYEVTQGLY